MFTGILKHHKCIFRVCDIISMLLPFLSYHVRLLLSVVSSYALFLEITSFGRESSGLLSYFLYIVWHKYLMHVG
ncbi:hypothetical protein L1987_69947 [Smallanthus sonchifolius]|uniref:Uncharacterized protein n=1 Tax=Smallanthus sonchifolius TaxID=185202 RepID=A0ACB9B6X3_9ASTR|nr:hypothetical protein L1987_69947 [Smallanthus sonchifolius]